MDKAAGGYDVFVWNGHGPEPESPREKVRAVTVCVRGWYMLGGFYRVRGTLLLRMSGYSVL